MKCVGASPRSLRTFEEEGVLVVAVGSSPKGKQRCRSIKAIHYIVLEQQTIIVEETSSVIRLCAACGLADSDGDWAAKVDDSNKFENVDFG